MALFSFVGFALLIITPAAPHSVVGTATHYGLDGSGFELRWGPGFSLPVQKCPGGSPTLLHNRYLGVFPDGLSGRGVALTTHPHPAPRLKKEYSFTSTLPLGLHGPLQSETYFYPTMIPPLPPHSSTAISGRVRQFWSGIALHVLPLNIWGFISSQALTWLNIKVCY